MPDRIQQLWLMSPGELSLEKVRMPAAAPGGLVIRVEAALTCGTDLKAYLRGHSLIPMPGPFGHEFSGVVVSAGKGVARFAPGDAVMAVHSAPCRACPYCKKKLFNLCENIMGSKVLGAFGQYLALPPHVVRENTFKKPRGLSFEEAAFLEPLSCVVHGIKRAEPVKGACALVIGAGPIGLLHLMLLKAKGLRVAVCALEPSRLKLAKNLGADIASTPGRLSSRLKKFAPIGADLVFECTGRREVWEHSVNYARRGGTVMLFGGLEKGASVSFPAQRIHYDEIALKGSFHFCPEDVRDAYGLLARRKIDVRPLVSGVYPLSKAETALKRLARGQGIKYVLRP